MIKHYCDCCGREIKSNVFSFDPLIHIIEEYDGTGGYVDLDGHAVSGRTEHFDLCVRCYNLIFLSAYKVFKSIPGVMNEEKQSRHRKRT